MHFFFHKSNVFDGSIGNIIVGQRALYFPGVHIYFEGQIHEVTRSISGYRKPSTAIY